MATSDAASHTEPAGDRRQGRVFLVVVDDSEEMHNALLFACRRAQRTGGRVALLYVIEEGEFQHWLGVQRVMHEEARDEAEATLQRHAGTVRAQTGTLPILYLREGNRAKEVLKVIEEEPNISVVVLGTAVGQEDPGPLVTHLIRRMGDRLRVPLTLVPGTLSAEEIDDLS